MMNGTPTPPCKIAPSLVRMPKVGLGFRVVEIKSRFSSVMAATPTQDLMTRWKIVEMVFKLGLETRMFWKYGTPCRVSANHSPRPNENLLVSSCAVQDATLVSNVMLPLAEISRSPVAV